MNWFDELKKWLGNTFGGGQQQQPPKPQPKPAVQQPRPMQPAQPIVQQPRVTNAVNFNQHITGQSQQPAITAKNIVNPPAQQKPKDAGDIEWQKGYDFAKQHGKNHEEAMQLGHKYKDAYVAKVRADNANGIAKAVNAPITAAKAVIDTGGRFIGDTGDNINIGIGNTIKRFDNNNQIANRLIDHSKRNMEQRNRFYDNTFGALKKTDQDSGIVDKVARSTTRLALDAAVGSKLGAATPAIMHGIETRNKTIDDAMKHGKSFNEAHDIGTANAATQAAIEKVGLDKVMRPIGKTVARRALAGALSEGSEEAAQQITDNAFGKTYDSSRKLMDGVAESAALGAITGGMVGGVSYGRIQDSKPVTTVAPKNEAEHRHAVENGIVTPATKHASYEDKLETARNSDLAPQNQTGFRRAQGGPSLVMPESTQQGVQQNTEVRYKLNPKHAAEVRAYNEHIGLLRQQESNLLEQGLSENSAPVINNRKAQAEAIKARDNVGKLDERGVRYKRRADTTDSIVINDRTGETLAERVAILEGNSWRSKDIDAFKQAVIDKHLGIKGPEPSLDERVRPYKYNLGNTVYHGTGHEAAPFIRQDGLKAGSELDESSYRGGGYGAIQDSISVTPSRAVAENFALNNGRRGVIVTTRIKDGINVVEVDGIDMAEDLNDIVQELRNRGIDAVWLEGEQELAIINKGILDDSLDIEGLDGVKYKIQAYKSVQTKVHDLQRKNDLLARHLQLTGDERVLFNEWRNDMEREASGYYDPATDTINVNDLTLDTLNHEIAHKALQRSQKSQQLIDEVRRRVGDDALIARYGDEYGTSDLDLLAEEYIADGFAEYYSGKLLGESDQRLASRLGIPPRLVAIYDRIAQALRSLIGKRDDILAFYAQIETGKYRNKQLAGNPLGLQPAYKLEDTLRGFENSSNHTPVAKIGDVEVVLGDYGRNAASRKSGKIDRFDESELAETLQYVEAAYKSGNTGFRKDNLALVSVMPNGEKRAIYTRLNKNGQEEVINWHKITIPGYEDGLKSYGTPAWSRTRSFGLERLAGNPPHRSVKEKGLASSKSSLHSSDIVADDTKNVNGVKYRRKAVSKDEITSEALAPYNLKLTKTDINSAIDEVIEAKHPELLERQIMLETELQSVQDRDALGVAGGTIRPEDARQYFGKDYQQFMPPNYVRKDALPIDIQAQERDFDSVDDYIEHVIRPLQVRKELAGVKKEIETLQNNPDIRAEAKDLAESYVYEKAEREIGYEELEKRAEKAERRAAAKQREADYRVKYANIPPTNTLEKAKMVAGYRLSQGERHTIEDITNYIAAQTGLTAEQTRDVVQKEADIANIDITGERPKKRRITEDVPSLIDENGDHIPLETMVPNEATLRRIKEAKPGVEHAVAASLGDERAKQLENETGLRQMIYKNDDGSFSRYYQYKNSKGRWQGTGAAAVRLKSPLQSDVIQELADNKALTKEANRAREEQRGIQYIWTESRQGQSVEFLSDYYAHKNQGKVRDKAYRAASTLVQYDPDNHHIESGRVVESKTGKILGNYLEVTETGDVFTYAGGKKVSLKMKDIDWDAIKELKTSGNTWTTEGIIQRMTGILRGANTVDYFKNGANKTAETLYHIMIEMPRKALRNATQEANAVGGQINLYEKKFNRALEHLPRSERKAAHADAVLVLEPPRPEKGETVAPYAARLKDFREKYGEEAAAALDTYNGYMRALYKNLLLRQNEVRRRQGKELIKERKDYITHTSELGRQDIGNLLAGAKNLMSSGEVLESGRGKLPAKIAGKTKDYKPTSKYNPFANRRFLDDKPLNAFDPVRTYTKVALHNIHMNDTISMNRGLEAAVRSLSELRSSIHEINTTGINNIASELSDAQEVLDESIKIRDNVVDPEAIKLDDARKMVKKIYGLHKAIGGTISGFDELSHAVNKIAYKQRRNMRIRPKDVENFHAQAAKVKSSLKKAADNADMLQAITDSANGLSKFTIFVQEHANRLAGKTDAQLRLIKDEGGDGAKFGLSALQLAQKQAALSRIVGNMSSVAAQTLSLTHLSATTSPKAMIKAMMTMRNADEIVKKSDAMMVRYTENTLDKDTKFDKVMRVGGKPMEMVERNVMRYEFVAKYLDGKAKSMTEEQAVKYAERFIGDTVTFRDAISTPRVYNRPIGALLQFTREVTQGHRYSIYQMNKKQQLAYFAAITPVAYTVFESITGVKPGMNIIGAIIGVVLSDDDDEDTEKHSPEWFLNKTLELSQKLSAEMVAGVPIANAGANVLPQDWRKSLFGTESSLGRFSGAPAALGTIGAVADFAKGMNKARSKDSDGFDKYTEEEAAAIRGDAWQKLLREVPMGSQIRKSIKGIDAMAQGYVENQKGESIADIQDTNNPLKWVQAAVLGPNALYEAQAKRGENPLINFMKGDGDAASAASGPPLTPTKELQKLERTRDKGEKKGEWKRNESGVWTDKDGDVKRDYYKDRARIAEMQGVRNEDTYFAYLHGYGLEKGTKYDKNVTEKVSTGDETLDKLLNADNEKSSEGIVNRAIELFSDKKKYKNVPDWVKEKFYQEAGFNKKDIGYAALAKVSAETKIDLLYRPLANNPEQLVNALNQHRKKGINGKMIATNTVIDQLRREGLIDKAAAKALKAVEYTRGEDGTWSNSKAPQVATGAGRGGRGRGGGRAAGTFSASDIRRFMSGSVRLSNQYAVRPQIGTSIVKRSPRLRSLRNRKLATIRGGKVVKTRLG